MKFSDLDKKYGLYELAGHFCYPAIKTIFVVGGVAAMAVFGGLPAVVGGGIGLDGSLFAGFANHMASAPKSAGMIGQTLAMALPAVIGAGAGGLYAGLGFFAIALGTAAGIAASAVAAGALFGVVDLFAAHKLRAQESGAAPQTPKRYTSFKSTNLGPVIKYKLPAKIARLAGTFGIAAAIIAPAYHYREEARDLPVIRDLYKKQA